MKDFSLINLIVNFVFVLEVSYDIFDRQSCACYNWLDFSFTTHGARCVIVQEWELIDLCQMKYSILPLLSLVEHSQTG